MTYEYPATLLPPNHTRLERHLEMVIRHQFAGLPVDVLRQFWNPATCPAHLLPHLARQRSVDVWQDYWSNSIKRNVIAASISLHRIKGTRAAIEMALDALNQDYAFVEWFEPAAHHILDYTPAVCTAWIGFTGDKIRATGVQIPDLLQAISRAKRLSLHISIAVTEQMRHATEPAPVVASHAWGPNPTPRETADGGKPPTHYVYSHLY